MHSQCVVGLLGAAEVAHESRSFPPWSSQFYVATTNRLIRFLLVKRLLRIGGEFSLDLLKELLV
jgi:hypothetical protein